MNERHGTFTIPTRLFVSAEHRRRLEQIVREQGIDLPDLISRVVAEYLDALPETLPQAEAKPDNTAVLEQHRAEMARLKARRDAEGPRAPAWLHAYIAELEADVRRLEQP
jgi:hypothetical protein